MKLKSIFVFIIFIGFIFTGCAHNNDSKYIPPDEVAKIQSADVIKYLKNEDTEGLKKMFCKKVSETHDLDKEIQGAYDFIDGKIVSYDTPDGSVGGGTNKYGETLQKSLQGSVDNIKTNTGKIYGFGYESYYIYKNSDEKVGITYINIFTESGMSYRIGGFIE